VYCSIKEECILFFKMFGIGRNLFMQRFLLLKRFSFAMAFLVSVTVPQGEIYAAKCPCDIYKDGGTPCAAAHSTVRALFADYSGPLYQVRRLSDSKTQDIAPIAPGGVANTAAQDSFLNGKQGTVSIIYDQSANHNDLKSHYSGLWTPADTEANLSSPGAKLKLNGHTVYGIYTFMGWTPAAGVGYRNNATKGLVTGNAAEGMYSVIDARRFNGNCCFDYGNAETDAKDDGNATMECIYYGSSTMWGHGAGKGPWVMNDLENGMYAGATTPNNNYPSIDTVAIHYLTAIVKGKAENWFGIRVGNAQQGKLETKYAGARPNGYNPMKLQGAIILGTGGDNSHGAIGTWYEGAITVGCPPDTTEDAVQANILAAGYGKETTSLEHGPSAPITASMFKAQYNPSNGRAVISYSLRTSKHISITILDQKGRLIADIENGTMSSGRHSSTWNAKRAPAGVYACKAVIDGAEAWAGKIIVGK